MSKSADSVPADVACVQWNRKVQHILATTSSSGVTVVWDLKAKRPVIYFSDKSVAGRCRAMAWHPVRGADAPPPPPRLGDGR